MNFVAIPAATAIPVNTDAAAVDICSTVNADTAQKTPADCQGLIEFIFCARLCKSQI